MKPYFPSELARRNKRYHGLSRRTNSGSQREEIGRPWYKWWSYDW